MDFAVNFAMDLSQRGDWSLTDGASWQLSLWSTWIKAKPGRNLVHTFGFYPPGVGGTLAQVAAGNYDSHYRTLANRLAQYGLLNIYLRPGWEMDGNWYPWQAPAGSGKEANFAAAFRRVITVMRQAQPTNKWKILFSPTDHMHPNVAYLESIWPGDAYVDIVAPDIYDMSWYNIDGSNLYYPAGSNRLDRQQKVWAIRLGRLTNMKNFANAHGKPMGTAEWGLNNWLDHATQKGHGGDDNPYFIEQMHKFMVANNFVIAGYFDVSTGQPSDHRVGPTNVRHPLAGAKYKQLFGAGSQ
jgi:Glycosyl hydrolase family 26